jgi:hypothetical protein
MIAARLSPGAIFESSSQRAILTPVAIISISPAKCTMVPAPGFAMLTRPGLALA